MTDRARAARRHVRTWREEPKRGLLKGSARAVLMVCLSPWFFLVSLNIVDSHLFGPTLAHIAIHLDFIYHSMVGFAVICWHYSAFCNLSIWQIVLLHVFSSIFWQYLYLYQPVIATAYSLFFFFRKIFCVLIVRFRQQILAHFFLMFAQFINTIRAYRLPWWNSSVKYNALFDENRNTLPLTCEQADLLKKSSSMKMLIFFRSFRYYDWGFGSLCRWYI